MTTRKLGRSGLKISRLCLGSMMFGAATDVPTANRIVDRGRDAGINFIDTADSYNGGRSEEIVGAAVKSNRDWWVVATKIASQLRDGPNEGGLSRRYVFRAVEESLRRLGLDEIDILYLHKADEDTPMEETVGALADVIRSGKVRYIGVSNHRTWRLAEMCRLCDLAGIERPVVSQPCYNLVNRTPEVEHLPACDYFGLGVAPYSPLARGVLTGKYVGDATPTEGSRAGRHDPRMMQTEWRPESIAVAQKIVEHIAGRGFTAGQFAVAWLLNNKLISAPVAGPRTEEQWEDYLGALEVKFTADDEAFVDTLVTPGHPSTPGYTDPIYPVEGRVPLNGNAV